MRRQPRVTCLQASRDNGATWGTLRTQPGIATPATKEGREVLAYLAAERQRWQANYHPYADAQFRIGYLDSTGRFTEAQQ